MKFKYIVSFQMDKNSRKWTEDSQFYYGGKNPIYFPSVTDMDSEFYLTPMCSKFNRGERIYVSSGDLLALNLESDALYEYITSKFENELKSMSTHACLTRYVTLDNGGLILIFMDNIYMDKSALEYLEESIDEVEFQSIKDSLIDKYGKDYYVYL